MTEFYYDFMSLGVLKILNFERIILSFAALKILKCKLFLSKYKRGKNNFQVNYFCKRIRIFFSLYKKNKNR